MSTPKKVPYAPIHREQPGGVTHPLYQTVDRLISTKRNQLSIIKYSLMWKLGIKPDIAGKLMLAMVRKTPDDAKSLHGFDIIIYLNHDFFHSPEITDLKREAVLYHEILHVDLAKDKEGSVRLDENGRPVISMIPHDISEFRAVVEDYGMYTQDVESFYQTLTSANLGQPRPLQPTEEPQQETT